MRRVRKRFSARHVNFSGAIPPIDGNDAAQTFFETFYSALATGASIRGAFANAQRMVRSGFVQVRDWAPFYLIEG
jgi:hypothetical protein